MSAPANRVGIMLTVARQLVQVLDAETDALRRLTFSELTELQAEKQALMDVYFAELDVLRRDPHVLGEVELNLREELEDETRHFQEAARRNGLALRAARTVIERALRVIAQSLAGSPAYHPGGDGRLVGQVVPFALDRTC